MYSCVPVANLQLKHLTRGDRQWSVSVIREFEKRIEPVTDGEPRSSQFLLRRIKGHPHITSSPPPPSSSIVITLQPPLPQIWHHQKCWFLYRDSSTWNSIIGWLILSSRTIYEQNAQTSKKRKLSSMCVTCLSMGYPSTPGCCQSYSQQHLLLTAVAWSVSTSSYIKPLCCLSV